VGEAALSVGAHRTSVGEWCARYLREGAASFAVAPGAGRKPRADKAQVEDAVRRSPRDFGVPRTRWTLAALADAVPCLRGMTPSGVRRALVRFGLSYKRGQPRLHSPDPLYGEKKGGSSAPSFAV
jgi:transposase